MKDQSDDHIIVAVHVTNRVRQAGRVQETLTRFGRNIKTRIGLHEADGKASSPNGMIILELIAGERRVTSLLKELNAIAGVDARSLVFSH